MNSWLVQGVCVWLGLWYVVFVGMVMVVVCWVCGVLACGVGIALCWLVVLGVHCVGLWC